MKIERKFTKAKSDPYRAIAFRVTDCEIRDHAGDIVFAAKQLQVPADWSQISCDILAQKYIYKGQLVTKLKKISEPGVPQWLQRSAADEAALAALPLTSGFYSKDLILLTSFDSPTGGPWFWVLASLAAFMTALLAVAFTGADSPNWFALISDVNLPEHRGTIFGLANFSNGVGRAAGNGLTGAVAGAIENAFPPPLNWAVGLSIFQDFFLPTGYCYYRAAGTSPPDIEEVRGILERRAAETSGDL